MAKHQHWHRLLVVAAVVAVVAVVAGAASSSDKKSTNESSLKRAAAASAVGVGAPAPGKGSGVTWRPACPTATPKVMKKKIGLVSLVGQDKGIQAHIQGIMTCAATYKWSIQNIDAKGDLKAAAAAIDDLIAKKVDAIMLITVLTSVVQPQLQKAAAAGIPVVAIDSPWVPGVTVALVNNVADAPSKLAFYIGDRFHGKANVGIVNSNLLSTASQWEKVFRAAIGAYPGVKIAARYEINLTNIVGGVQAAVQTMIQTHPDLNVIWVSWEDPTIGACNAKRILKSKVEIVTILTSGVAVDLFGSCINAAGSLPEITHGKAAAEQLASILKNGKPTAQVVYQGNGFYTSKPKGKTWMTDGVEYVLYAGTK